MNSVEYGFTFVDPKDGRARTFTVHTDSRTVAAIQIRSKAQQVNRDRLKGGCTRLVPVPRPEQLEATEAPKARRPAGVVVFYA